MFHAKCMVHTFKIGIGHTVINMNNATPRKFYIFLHWICVCVIVFRSVVRPSRVRHLGSIFISLFKREYIVWGVSDIDILTSYMIIIISNEAAVTMQNNIDVKLTHWFIIFIEVAVCICSVHLFTCGLIVIIALYDVLPYKLNLK